MRILKCQYCITHMLTHIFQDMTYGRWFRVMNITASKDARCTVCGQITKLHEAG